MKNINNTSTSIKNWSKDDQPYEKIKNYGPMQLSNSELLAILIKNGNKNNIETVWRSYLQRNIFLFIDNICVLRVVIFI